MYKRLLLVVLVGIVVVLPLSSAIASEIVRAPSEMIQWDPDKAYNGYNLFTMNGKTTAYLIDMEGYVVNTWESASGTPFGMYGHALENGRWRFHLSPSYVPSAPLQAGGSQGRIEEYTWEGERVWWMDVFDGIVSDGQGGYTNDPEAATFRFHHDAQRMYNNELNAWTYLALCWIAKDQTDADNLGVDPQLNGRSRTDVDHPTYATWSPCALVEILPDYAGGEGGEIVWFWTFADHMVTTDPGDTAVAGSWTDWSGRIAMPPVEVTGTNQDTNSIRANPQRLNVNGMHYTVPDGPRTDYQHCNSIDYDERTGYIAINAKATNEFFVVDHDGTFDLNAAHGTLANGWNTNAVGAEARTTAGDFLYRFGNPGNYYSGDPAGFYDEGDMEMYGTHDIQYIWNYHWRPPYAPGDNWEDPAIYGTEFALPGGGVLDENGLPRADNIGDFMMYDNGCYNPMNAGSKILEVNPYIYDRDAYDTSGSVETLTYPDGNPMFVLGGPDAIDTGGTPANLSRRDQVVWEFGGGRNGIYDFYSSYISGCTRMPNGNTIICAGANSHFMEVEVGVNGGFNSPSNIVWEYIMPQSNPDGSWRTYYEGSSMCFRFHRFAPEHPVFAGKTLKRGLTITGKIPGTTDTFLPGPAGPISGRKVGAGGGGGAAGAGGGGGGY